MWGLKINKNDLFFGYVIAVVPGKIKWLLFSVTMQVNQKDISLAQWILFLPVRYELPHNDLHKHSPCRRQAII